VLSTTARCPTTRYTLAGERGGGIVKQQADLVESMCCRGLARRGEDLIARWWMICFADIDTLNSSHTSSGPSVGRYTSMTEPSLNEKKVTRPAGAVSDN
jgi:hypothetical protein